MQPFDYLPDNPNVTVSGKPTDDGKAKITIYIRKPLVEAGSGSETEDKPHGTDLKTVGKYYSSLEVALSKLTESPSIEYVLSLDSKLMDDNGEVMELKEWWQRFRKGERFPMGESPYISTLSVEGNMEIVSHVLGTLQMEGMLTQDDIIGISKAAGLGPNIEKSNRPLS